MRNIKTKAVYEAVKLADRSAELAKRIRPQTAGRKKEDAPADYTGESADKIVNAGWTAVRKLSHTAVIRGRKRVRDIRIKERDIPEKESGKRIKTSDVTEKNGIRTEKNSSLRNRAAELKAGEERARGTAMAKKAYSAYKKAECGGRAAAAALKDRAGRMLRRALRAVSGQNVLFVGGGALAMCLVTVISMVGGIAASPFGIFFSIEEDGGASVRSIISDLSREFYLPIQEIQKTIPYDILEMESDNGMYGVQWDDILPVWTVYRTVGSGKDVVEVKEDSKDQLRGMMKDLTSFSYKISVTEISAEKEEEEEDEEDEEEEDEAEEIRTLTIRIHHGNIDQYTERLGFTDEQYKLLSEIKGEKYRSFWAKTAGAYAVGGQILIPFGSSSGLFSWPLSIAGSITSGFGYRTDPFTGEQKFHGGIDIGAAQGTPVLASSDGVVTVANGTDPWGGGYGYYVMVSHGNGYETLYGHCSAICVGTGQAVRKGEVIAYVGSTENSTGNHLHFEVRIGGQKVDPNGVL